MMLRCFKDASVRSMFFELNRFPDSHAENGKCFGAKYGSQAKSVSRDQTWEQPETRNCSDITVNKALLQLF